MAARIRFAIPTLLGLFAVCMSQLELDDGFLESRKDGMWLVEFYAPWCGYCKKLEPVYKEVDNELKQVNSPVKVAKLDCTRYLNIATEFSIRGFPTIMFIQGDRLFTHRGDRTKEDIVEFALRAQGPTVRQLTSADRFKEVLKQHSAGVFFLYVGDSSEQADLFKMYTLAANTFAIQSYFYYGIKDIVENLNMQRYPTVLVVKDTRFYEYESTDTTPTDSSLQQFINRERYATFPQVSGMGINDLSSVVRFLVILAVRPQDMNDTSTASARLFHLVKAVAFSQRDTFHSQFQFLWMDNTETVNTIATSYLATPVLMVMETESRLYFLNQNIVNLTASSLADYLTSVAEGKEQAYGGTGFLMRLKRLIFDLVMLAVSIWQTSRGLFFLTLGLPVIIISFICYSLCCMDVVDNMSDYEDDEEMEDEDQLYDDNSLPPIIPWCEELPPYGTVEEDLWKGTGDKKNE